jgi:ABC-2 type transport system permease protein
MPALPSTHRFGQLMLFVLWRDRLWLALWTVALLVLATSFAPVILQVAGDLTTQPALIETLSSPAMVALCGPSYGDEYSYGSLYAQFMLVWVILAFAVMNIMFVARHTRKDEEEGRAEMIGALPVGRNANLLAVLLTALGVNALLALLTGLIIPLFGIRSMDFAGAMVFGLAIGTNGLFFAGVTALFAQLFSTSKSTLGSSLAILGAAFLLRATGDVSSEILARVSPMGLVERSEAFVGNHLWPALILALVSFALCAVAFVLSAIRSSGQGMLPVRRGRAHATVFLRGELGFAWRLSRGVMIAWAAAVFLLAASYGAVFNDFDAFISGNQINRAMLGIRGDTSDIMAPIISTTILVMSIVAAIPVVVVALRLRSEESRGRVEQLLALSVSRVSLIIRDAIIAFLLAFILQALTALGMWGAAVATMDEPMEFALLFKTAMNFLPAVLVFAGLGLFFVGAAPRLTALIWVYLAYSFFATYLGGLFDLPLWVENSSVFGLLPRYPVRDIEPVRIVALCALSIVLVAVGAFAYRQRDLT